MPERTVEEEPVEETHSGEVVGRFALDNIHEYMGVQMSAIDAEGYSVNIPKQRCNKPGRYVLMRIPPEIGGK